MNLSKGWETATIYAGHITSVNGQAERTTGGPAKGDHLVQRERCFFPFSGHAWLEEAHSGLPAITEVSKG